MKMLIFLFVIGAVIYAVIWKMRKSQAEADLVKRKSVELRRQKEKEALASAEHMIWPVVGMSTSEDLASRDALDSEGLSMDAIEYEPPEQIAS